MPITVNVKMTRAIENSLKKEAPKTLLQGARLVQKFARSLIPQRRNPDDAANPGNPVHSHANGASRGFKNTIAYEFESDGRSILIGPKYMNGGLRSLAKTHEFGGVRQVKNAINPIFLMPVDKMVGEVGPMRLKYVSKSDSIVLMDGSRDPKSGDSVAWIRLRNKFQAYHSKRLYFRMNNGKSVVRVAHYAPRPYMRPALNFAKPKLSSFWSSAVRG